MYHKSKGETDVPERRRPNPDDRSDNVEKMQEMIHDTIENMHEAEESLEFASDEQKRQVRAKNERRKEAIEGFREEIKDEYRAQQER